MIVLPRRNALWVLGDFLPARIHFRSRGSSKFCIGLPRLPAAACGKQLQHLESVSHFDGIGRPIGDSFRQKGAGLSHDRPSGYGYGKESATWHCACSLSRESLG